MWLAVEFQPYQGLYLKKYRLIISIWLCPSLPGIPEGDGKEDREHSGPKTFCKGADREQPWWLVLGQSSDAGAEHALGDSVQPVSVQTGPAGAGPVSGAAGRPGRRRVNFVGGSKSYRVSVCFTTGWGVSLKCSHPARMVGGGGAEFTFPWQPAWWWRGSEDADRTAQGEQWHRLLNTLVYIFTDVVFWFSLNSPLSSQTLSL